MSGLCYALTWTGTSSGLRREFPRDLTTCLKTVMRARPRPSIMSIIRE